MQRCVSMSEHVLAMRFHAGQAVKLFEDMHVCCESPVATACCPLRPRQGTLAEESPRVVTADAALQASLRTAKASGRDRQPLRVFAAAPVMAYVKPRMPTRACHAAAPLAKLAGLSSSRSIRASAAVHRPAAVMFA